MLFKAPVIYLAQLILYLAWLKARVVPAEGEN